MRTLLSLIVVTLLAWPIACNSNRVAVSVQGRFLTYGAPELVGFSPERLAAAVDTIRRAVDEGRVTGVQLLVARHAKVVVHEALGLRDLKRHLPMENNRTYGREYHDDEYR